MPVFGLDRGLLAPRALVFLLLVVASLVEPHPGHVHWAVLVGYAVGTFGLVLRRRGRPLSRRLGWAFTVLDAALALYLIGEHGAALRAGTLSSPGSDMISQFPAFLFLLQSGLTLDLQRTVALAALIAFGWCGLLVAAAGSVAELGYQAYGLLAFGVAALFVIDGVQRLRASVNEGVRLEVERARLARFLPVEATGMAERNRVVPRHAAMMAVDVRGFSALTRTYGAAAVVPWLLEVRAIVHAAVIRHGGMVDKYMGDGVLAQFLDGPAERQAQKALVAALDLQRRILAWNHTRQVNRLPPLRVTVALHAGPVLAGVFDDGLRAEFTVLGPAMNALSRIERRTKEADYDLLASKRFARLLPPASYQDLRITRLVRRADETDAPDIVKIDVLERLSTSRVNIAVTA